MVRDVVYIPKNILYINFWMLSVKARIKLFPNNNKSIQISHIKNV